MHSGHEWIKDVFSYIAIEIWGDFRLPWKAQSQIPQGVGETEEV